ncbi:MAG: amino acid transporter [Cycloclasticus sp. symbiont of Bathymodiolus heckerae]|nr:MAG: amino acid transporter [Cycloclasticus sp. symbiont of Bathymodiolus heckerae]
MILNHLNGSFLNSDKEWIKIRDTECNVKDCLIKKVLVLAAIPAICAFIGATQTGWDIGDRSFKFTVGSTIPLVIGFYLACVSAIAILGKTIHWMADTYGTKKDLATCVLLATTVATPLLLSGVFAIVPVPWVIFLTGLFAIAYSVYLLYTGIPIVMSINPEKGFLFSSAVLTIALVTVVGILIATVILWAMGLAPVHV